MPTSTYTPLANITLGSSAASVTFSSISQAYRDLVLVVTIKGSAGNYANIRFNSDTGNNYNIVTMAGTGASTFSRTSANSNAIYLSNEFSTSTTDAFNAVFQVMDYSATDKHKTTLGRDNNANSGVEAIAGRWASTSAITSMSLATLDATTFAAGSTFALYGIAA